VKVEAISTRVGVGNVFFERAEGYAYPVADFPDEIGTKLITNKRAFREAVLKRPVGRPKKTLEE
jgi:hypothetical protein